MVKHVLIRYNNPNDYIDLPEELNKHWFTQKLSALPESYLISHAYYRNSQGDPTETSSYTLSGSISISMHIPNIKCYNHLLANALSIAPADWQAILAKSTSNGELPYHFIEVPDELDDLVKISENSRLLSINPTYTKAACCRVNKLKDELRELRELRDTYTLMFAQSWCRTFLAPPPELDLPDLTN